MVDESGVDDLISGRGQLYFKNTIAPVMKSNCPRQTRTHHRRKASAAFGTLY
jgi:hypothetical protein